jgi:hypothetical protein
MFIGGIGRDVSHTKRFSASRVASAMTELAQRRGSRGVALDVVAMMG